MQEISVSDWASGLADVVFTPAEDRQPVSYEAAQLLLRCSVESVRNLLYAGLPTVEGTVDYLDVVNAGLYSNTQKTGPELQMLAMGKLMHSAVRCWRDPARWVVRLEGTCSKGDECKSGRWRVATLEGSPWQSMHSSMNGSEVKPPGGFHEFTQASGPILLECVVETHCRGQDLVSGECRTQAGKIVRDYRFMYRYPQLSLDATLTEQTRAGDCLALSALLVERLADEGIEARIQRGIMIGALTAHEHSWVRIIQHGAPSFVDVSLAAMAQQWFNNPELREFCFGRLTSRAVLAPALLPSDRLLKHSCEGGPAPFGYRLFVTRNSHQPLMMGLPSLA